MEMTKKTTFRKIQFFSLLAMLVFSLVIENSTYCKSLSLSNSEKTLKRIKSSSKKSKSSTRKKWFSSLLNAVKTNLPPGMVKDGISLFAENILSENIEQESHLFKGIAEALGFSISKKFETCIKRKFFPIQEKVNPIIIDYQKIINDIDNFNAHIAELTILADMCVDAYNKIASCNQPEQPENKDIFNKLVNVGVQIIGSAIKKQVRGSIDGKLATEMARRLKLIKEFKGADIPNDDQAKGKLLGGLIKAVVDERGSRRLRRRRI